MADHLLKMFFQNWTGLIRTVIVGVLAYLSLVTMLRVTGKRTLSKMNAFDLIVTVALGSVLATIILSKDVPLAEGVAAFGLLVSMQYIITWLSVRSRRVSRLVKSEPNLLLYKGRFLQEAMRRERVNEEEVHAAIRSQGVAFVEEVEAVVLETDGSISVVKVTQQNREASSLAGVARSK